MTTKTTIIPQTELHLNHFLDRIETGLSMSDAESGKRLESEVSKAFSDIAGIEVRLEPEAREEANLLKSALDEMRVQLALGRMESADEIEKLEGSLEKGFRNFKEAITHTKNLTKEEISEIHEKLRLGWLNLRAETVLATLRISLAREKGAAKVAAAKEEIYEDFERIRKLAGKSTEEVRKRSAQWVERAADSVGERAHRVLESINNHTL